MIKQQQVLLATEGVDLVFTDGAIKAIAEAAHQANLLLDNIGARRLHTVVERVLADISFSAPEKVAEQQRHKQQAEQQQQQQRQKQEAVQTASNEADGSTVSSGKGAKSKAGSRSSSRSKAGSSKEAVGNSSSSISRLEDHGSGDTILQYVVTEDMVQSCMKEVLKQKDLSRYML
jgi:ATP-dependent protease HslVU (ClpYQ) ATPase subunit